MSTTDPLEPTWARLASALLAPPFVLSAIWATIVIGVASSSSWGVPLFWALMILTAGVTAIALLGAEPLPAVAEHSHLLQRLGWLGRYGTAAGLLCVSTFIGVVAGFQAGTPDPQSVVDGASELVGVVALWAIRIGAVLFFGWLVLDVSRMGPERRRMGLKRSIRKLLGRELEAKASHQVVLHWLLSFSSPPMVAVSLGAIVLALLSALGLLESQQ